MTKERSNSELEADVEKLREWLKKQPHLPKDIDENILKSFVHGTKSLEIAKQKLDTSFTLRASDRKLFQFPDRDPTDPDFKKASKSLKKFVLSNVTPDGYRVIWHSMNLLEFDKCFVHSQEIVRHMMLMEITMKFWPKTKGIVFIYDLKGLTNSIFLKLSPTLLASGIRWFQVAYPIKLKKVLILNAPSFMETIVDKMVKPFLKSKIFNRIIVTSEDKSCLLKHFPKDVLPSDLGGKDKTTEQLNDEWIKILEDNRNWFEKLSKQMADETKRPPDGKDTFGIQGTFRTLSLD